MGQHTSCLRFSSDRDTLRSLLSFKRVPKKCSFRLCDLYSLTKDDHVGPVISRISLLTYLDYNLYECYNECNLSFRS